MKIFCMICGRGNEYIGMSNKPSVCGFCSHTFSKEYSESPIAVDVVSTTQSKFLPLKDFYSVGGMRLSRNCFLDVISFEREPEGENRYKTDI